MNKIASLLLLLPLMGCMTGTVSDDLTVDKSFSFSLPPAPNTGVVTPVIDVKLTQSTQVDESKAISKLSSLGTLSFSITSSTLLNQSNLNLEFLMDIKVDLIQPNGSDLLVCDAPVNGTATNTIDLPIVASSSDLQAYLGSGPVTLQVTLEVATNSSLPTGSQTLNMEYVLVLNANESVSKSL